MTLLGELSDDMCPVSRVVPGTKQMLKRCEPPLSRGSTCLMTHARADMLGAPSPHLPPAHPGPLSVREAGGCHHREHCRDKEGSELTSAESFQQGPSPGVARGVREHPVVVHSGVMRKKKAEVGAS